MGWTDDSQENYTNEDVSGPRQEPVTDFVS